MAGITHADADGVTFAFPEGEVIGKGGAESLAKPPLVPVAGGIELEVIEDVEAQGDFFVGFVGDQLGESAGAEHQGDKGKQYFFHNSRFVISLETTKIGINLKSITNSLKFGGVCRATHRFLRR